MDSDNILSVLSFLQGQQPSPPGADAPDVQLPGVGNNVLQAVAPQPQAPQAPSPIVTAANAAAPPMPKPRQRRSLADIIGHIADGLAQAGGATPMYQRTLDAEQTREFATSDHARLVDMDALRKRLAEQQVAAGDVEPLVAERKRIGTALGALAGQENAAALWPHIAEQAGIDPQKAAAIGQILTNNPASAGILAKSLGADVNNLGKNVYFGTNTEGKTVAYQVGPDGHPHVLDFNGGITPSDPIKVVNTGGANVIIGSGGTVKKILPSTIAPGTAATIRSNESIADRNNASREKIAGMPARSKDGTTAGKGGDDGNVPRLLDNIQAGFADLHRMKALPGEGSGVGQLEGAFSRSPLGQKLGEQLGTVSAQKRLEIMKNVSALQQAMLKSLPASATRTKFEQEMLARGLPDPSKMSYDTANTVIRQLRESYAAAVAALKKTTPVQPRPKASSGWSVVGVK